MEADGWDQESAARKLVEALGKRKDLASVVSQTRTDRLRGREFGHR